MKHSFPFSIGTIHIIGIGGIGMSGYADVLHHMGCTVQGSDQSENANTKRLNEMGIKTFVGHKAENIKGATIVVRSTAVKDNNPEVVAARRKKIPVIPRVDLLSEIMRGKWCVNVSGTHGKTTTTSMIGHILEQADHDPTVINGGIINAYGSNIRMGDSKWLVVESDESDGTFGHLPSVISIVTNIDPEHLEFHGDFETLKDAFVSYVHNLPFYGIAVACIDHPVVEELLPQFDRRTITYGFSDKADIQAYNVRTTPQGLVYDVRFNADLGEFPALIENIKLPMFGPHNVLNSLTTFAAASVIGIGCETVVEALATFSGVKRRFTTTGIVNGITVIDDYAHHPVEVAAVLKAGRDVVANNPGARVIAVMQPHKYSRLSRLFDDFAKSFALADEIIIADVYSAGEEPIDGYNRDTLVEAIRKTGKTNAQALGKPEDLAKLVSNLAKNGDYVICLGAGNITQWAYALPKEMEDIAGLTPKNGTK